MKRKTNPSGTAVQLEQARESREALIKALNTLLQALHNLRGSLLTLQTGISEMQQLYPLTPAPAKVKAAHAPHLDLRKKPTILH